MKVLQVHNWYRVRAGEATAVNATVRLLRERGVDVHMLTRDSAELSESLRDRMRAFLSGVYSRSARRETERLLDESPPDVVHVHNVYPLLSPSVVAACRAARVPVVMSCHNYRLICPIGTLFVRSRLCARCVPRRAYWCALRDCRSNVPESIAFALRSMADHALGWMRNSVALFLAPSQFVRERLASAGVPEDRLVVVPHPVPPSDPAADPGGGNYAAFVGRVSPEKGVDILLAAAAQCPDVPVRITGQAPPGASPLPNVQFTGWLDADGVRDIYAHARFVILPSVWYETFGLSLAEAMSRGVPALAARIGALPELVRDGVTGLLCTPGDADGLARAMRRMWDDPEFCRRAGAAARRDVVERFAPDAYCERLLAAYRRAGEMCQTGTSGGST